MNECEVNPTYMLNHCAKSCLERRLWPSNNNNNNNNGQEGQPLKTINSIYELSALDIDGEEFRFVELKGMTAVIVNVASNCKRTEQHYRELNLIYDMFKKTNKFEILAFPSNQFNDQEPGSCADIKLFTEHDRDVEFRMMDKIHVNGYDTHEVYKYLKHKTGIQSIEWNFDTYFIVTPSGEIISHSGVNPLQLKKDLNELVFTAEL